MRSLLLALLLAGPPAAPAPAAPASAAPASAAPAPKASPPKAAPAPRAVARATTCRPESARRCSSAGCEDAGEGLHAELFDLDVEGSTLGACLYTDCYQGKAVLVRERATPWVVTAFGLVHSERPDDAVPPPGSDPFPLTVTVDLKTGRFSAIWSLSPAGLQVDFGTCELRAN